MKKLLIGFLCVVLVVCGVPMTGEAKLCNHKYVNDICKKCKYIRVHEFEEPILFYTLNKNVVLREKPDKKSDVTEKISDADTMIEVDGILRNQHGNIWLRACDEKGYTYIENLYLNFESLVLRSWQKISAFEGESAVAAFYTEVYPDGPANYKKWLDPSSKGIVYDILIDGEHYSMTAEELGNINYGFLGRIVGFTDEVLLYAGGAVNILGKANPKVWENSYDEAVKVCSVCNSFLCDILERDCIDKYVLADVVGGVVNECSKTYCDSADDVENIKKGIEYYEKGKFSY